ncbi:hypothetical protein [Encephalitozoon cuniculi GB-M1]|uniref:UPF0328 protein ECU07_1870/ECU10_0030 n=2 Tax=Encephalitozoon cuniculi (strain GB-M1) TaxID=284813 RepID=Y7I7_ENCCU|nr:uncharacterized protein ECU07_1870 [Encephalitozoon cuniculi GB-M1]NP_586119.1 uncharacterized protein ECU10_0030 [Encephalitozoon cuniculi GB-M1]Q8STJ1.1 RecName: Full=UPF0328 protein ECU07_1870/ECU10_0030 [Encephalitozoon cuniculi GB-M1]CAD25718.1 hypothetical protein [Encephalitozoon cuniculi GB-M1]CAD25723.1 hypothetical protein [Encephalitozoon cuniculi GB-M1]
MNTTHVPEPHRTEQHTENQPHWKKILGIAPFVSIAFPAVMYFILTKDSFKDSPFLKFITVLLPYLHPPVLHLLLLHTNWRKTHKSKHTILYCLVNLLLLAFAVANILSIVALIVDKQKRTDDLLLHSIILPSFFIPPAYLLSTSCCLVPGQIGFTDTGINVIIDILILICPAISLVLVDEKSKYYPYSTAIPSILILVRLFREKCSPPKQSSPPIPTWRVAAFVFILVLAVLVYGLLGSGSIITLYDHFHPPKGADATSS